MKKHFITGLIIFLPLALTLIIVYFLFNLVTRPFIGMTSGLFKYYDLLPRGFLFLSPEQIHRLIGQLLVLIFLFFIISLLGLFARWFFVHYLVRLSDYIFHRIPFVRVIYKASQQFVKTFFGEESVTFKQVVLAPFPDSHSYAVGLVTGDEICGKNETDKRISVFIATTPNPTTGFLVLYRKEDLIYLDTTIEDAVKYIVSCGVILPSVQKSTVSTPEIPNPTRA